LLKEFVSRISFLNHPCETTPPMFQLALPADGELTFGRKEASFKEEIPD
jgi:hypothetical protein